MNRQTSPPTLPPAEFYIGYEPKAPPGVARFVRAAVVAIVAVAAAGGFAAQSFRTPVAGGSFAFGDVRPASGVYSASPVPALWSAGAPPAVLVDFGKRGADERFAGFDGAPVALAGTAIERDGVRMIEVAEGPSAPAAADPAAAPLPPEESLGTISVAGEIVDSKCWTGVMAPGEGIVHRDCAIRCISGGIPPMLVATDREGRALHAYVVGPRGEPIGGEILDAVGLPVFVQGELYARGEILSIRISPDAIRLLRR